MDNVYTRCNTLCVSLGQCCHKELNHGYYAKKFFRVVTRKLEIFNGFVNGYISVNGVVFVVAFIIMMVK